MGSEGIEWCSIESEIKNSNITKILEVAYNVKNSMSKTIESEFLAKTTIESLSQKCEDSVRLSIPVKIPPECYAEFKFKSQSLLKPDGIDPIISLVSTTSMEIDIVFPSNIRANALGIHPDLMKFELEIDQLKRSLTPTFDIPHGSPQSDMERILEESKMRYKTPEERRKSPDKL